MRGPRHLGVRSIVWLKERRERGVRSVDKEESRIRHHLLPRIGSKRLDEIRPRDIRDLIRALRAGGELAPRTIHRHGLRLRHYSEHMPNLARVRISISTDRGPCYSEEIEMSQGLRPMI